MPISSWSHSKIVDFEKCKFLAYLKHDQRVPEPERPLRPGQTEHANDRGSRIHDHAENYVNGTHATQLVEMRHFAREFEVLRDLHARGIVSLEGEWAVDRDWNPVAWSGYWLKPATITKTPQVVKTLPARAREGDCVAVNKVVYEWVMPWHRSKIDALVVPDEYQAIVIDYKTGKKFGNEIKHAEQTQLYALNAVLRMPKLEEVTTELWYTDQDDITITTFRRDQILRFKKGFDMRGTALTTATAFPPNPNKFSCQWCQYGPWNGGQCKVGVR